jgi:hypothetical protein
MDANYEKRMARMYARREDRKTDQEKSDENMETMQARLDAWQARMDANHEMRMTRRVARLTERRNDRKETMACLEQTEARLEVEDKPASVDTTPEVAHGQEVPLEADLEKIEPNPGETEAVVERQEIPNEEIAIHPLRGCRNEGRACQETMEARLEQDKPASADKTPEVAHNQEVPRENAVEMPAGEPRKRRRDQRHLAAVRRQKERQRNLDPRRRGKEQDLVAARRGATRRVQVARRNILSTKDTTRKDLAATGRKETRRAKVTWHKRNFVGRNRRKEIATGGNHTKDKVERGTQRILALKKTFWTRQIGRVGPEGLSGGTYVVSRNVICWDLWRGRPPPKRKK